MLRNLCSFLATLLLVAIFLPSCKSDDKPVYKDSTASTEERVEDLISRMTLEEKLAQFKSGTDTTQMPHGVGSLGFMNNNLDAHAAAEEYNAVQRYLMNSTRLGIPAVRSGEGIFAYMGNGASAFPQSIAIASTWDTTLLQEMATAIRKEIKSRGIRRVLSPVVNLARDVRWGRTGETYGEDPYLSARMGVTYAKTMEDYGMLTMTKHFVANMGLEGRFGAPVHFSERLLRENYFPAFKACFVEGGSRSVMMAYNTLDGIPCCMHKWLIEDILRGEWGFDGYVSADGGGMQIVYEQYGVAETQEELTARAVKAGCDRSDFHTQYLEGALEQGLITEADIDRMLRRILTVRFDLGLFEDPYVDPAKAEAINDCQEHRDLALKLARKSVTLLKNENNILPFDKETINKVAVLGPCADWLLINHYGGWGRKEVTLLDGLKNTYPDKTFIYERGAELAYMSQTPIEPEYLTTPEGKPGIKAEYFKNRKLEGEAAYTETVSQINFNWKEGAPNQMPDDGFSIRYTGKLKSPGTGVYKLGATVDDGVRVWIDDKLVLDMWFGGNRRMVEADFEFEEGRTYDLKMEYYDDYHLAYAQLGWDRDPYHNISKAVEAAQQADAVVIAVGMKDDENEDRADLDLNPEQEALIREVAKTGKPVAVIILTGTVITMHDWIDDVPAVIQAWYPGEEGGNALAETLFGDNVPAGKLPVTIPQVTGQVPMNYNHLPYKTRDTYVGIGTDPQFAFGHGLSYTTFAYSNLKLSSESIASTDNITISVDVKNTGKRNGDEIVQLYLHDEIASISRPVKYLAGFKRISLKAGESQTVTFNVKPDQLGLYDENMQWVVEPGTFKVMVGSASDDIRQESSFTVK